MLNRVQNAKKDPKYSHSEDRHTITIFNGLIKILINYIQSPVSYCRHKFKFIDGSNLKIRRFINYSSESEWNIH